MISFDDRENFSIVFTLELLTLEKLWISLLRNLYGIESDIATVFLIKHTNFSSIFNIFSLFIRNRRPANINLINLNDVKEIRKFNVRIYVDLRNDGILRLKLFIIVDDAEEATRYARDIPWKERRKYSQSEINFHHHRQTPSSDSTSWIVRSHGLRLGECKQWK